MAWVLGQFNPLEAVTANGSSPGAGGLFSELWVVLAATLVVCGLIMVWAVFIRKPSREKSEFSGAFSRTLVTDPPESTGVLKRRRRRRRPSRPRRATLAETGGLPPARPTDDPPQDSRAS